MIRNTRVNMLRGKLIPSMLRYAVPLMLVSLISTMFNAVDIMVLGQMADTNAVASVGATSSLIFLLVSLFTNIGGGARVILAQQIGADAKASAEKTVSTSIITALGLGLLTGITAFSLAPAFLRLTGCPQECFDGALLYMRIYVCAAPAIMLYSFSSAIINVSGDSKSPLYYMIISGSINVVLNFVLCLILQQKVAAVAISTAVAQLAGALLCIRRLMRLDGICRFSLKRLIWDFKTFRKLLKIGLPMTLTGAMIPIANLQIQPQINSFGPNTIAACSAVGSLEGIAAAFSQNAFGSTTTAFVGQNLGAKQLRRVRDSILSGLLLCSIMSIAASTVVILFSEPLLSLYLSEQAAVEIAQIRMKYTLNLYLIASVNGILVSVITAFGYTLFSSCNALVSTLLFRTVWMIFIYPQAPTMHTLFLCYPISWLFTLTFNISVVLYLYFGKLKKGTLKRLI